MVYMKAAIALLFLSICQAHVYTPDCGDAANQDLPQCLCRNPNNADLDVCVNWYDKVASGSGSGMTGRIVNGEVVNPKNLYPWFARMISYPGGAWWGCGGMLVAPEYVLTAAHCVEEGLSGGGFEIGAYDRSSSTNGGVLFERRGASQVISHPDYNRNTMRFDFALVKLSARVDNIAPVPMDSTNISNGYADAKPNLWPIGFGALSSGGSTSTLLRHVETKYVLPSRCNDSSMYNGEITADMMCSADVDESGNGYEDSCQGDSGGPLYDSDNNVLVGVVSWGYGCADPKYPGVYARVAHQYSWIASTICDSHSDPKPSFCSGDDGPPPTPPSPTPPSPSPPSPSPPTCTDSPIDWVDSDQWTCQDYADVDNACEYWGDGYAGPDGQTANQACCVCGGGIKDDGPPPPGPTCQDTDEKFVIGTRDRQCKYVYNRWTSRCTDAVKALCPVSCAQSCTPVDTVGKFELRPGVLKTCKWASNNVSKRCRNYVVHANCPVTCGVNPE